MDMSEFSVESISTAGSGSRIDEKSSDVPGPRTLDPSADSVVSDVNPGDVGLNAVTRKFPRCFLHSLNSRWSHCLEYPQVAVTWEVTGVPCSDDASYCLSSLISCSPFVQSHLP